MFSILFVGFFNKNFFYLVANFVSGAGDGPSPPLLTPLTYPWPQLFSIDFRHGGG